MTVRRGGSNNRRPMSVTEAVTALNGAHYARASADALGHFDPEWGAKAREDAEALEDEAEEALTPDEPLTTGRGGELVPPDETGPVRSPPNLLHAEASRERLTLIGSRAALALDLAESIGAESSAEKMLAHQMAQAYELVMRLARQAIRFANKAECFDSMDAHAQAGAANIEASRCAHAAAKLMASFQGGMLTLDTLRNGRKQMVTVQHVNVQNGGQALVAGAMTPPGRGE
jgi:hypothetical protein